MGRIVGNHGHGGSRIGTPIVLATPRADSKGNVVSNFVNLNKTLLSMQIDPATAKQPIKRMFVADGDFLSANVSILTDSENALHTQPDHDEIVLVLEGEGEFRVGEEVRRVGPGDLIFIPRNTVHGPILGEEKHFSALSVFAPFFDRERPNIEWDRDEP